MARKALEQEPVTLGKRKAIDEMEYAERAAKVLCDGPRTREWICSEDIFAPYCE